MAREEVIPGWSRDQIRQELSVVDTNDPIEAEMAGIIAIQLYFLKDETRSSLQFKFEELLTYRLARQAPTKI